MGEKKGDKGMRKGERKAGERRAIGGGGGGGRSERGRERERRRKGGGGGGKGRGRDGGEEDN